MQTVYVLLWFGIGWFSPFSLALIHWHWVYHIDGLVQERCNSSALAMALRLLWTNPLICPVPLKQLWKLWQNKSHECKKKCWDNYIITEHYKTVLYFMGYTVFHWQVDWLFNWLLRITKDLVICQNVSQAWNQDMAFIMASNMHQHLEWYLYMPLLAGWLACLNTLRPGQDGRHFADDIFTCIFFNENGCILIKLSMKYVRKGPIDNNPSMVQIMAWRRSVYRRI